MLGVLALIGILIRNSVILVVQIDELRSQGRSVSMPVECSPIVPFENSPFRFGLIATVSAWRVDVDEVVLIGGTTVTVKVAHLRLFHRRMLLVRAYPRETQEIVFDAHDRAFAFFKDACTRGIYDNLKTAVYAIFAGRERTYNRRLLQMCGHYLIEPVARTPASGWEKGQVENQVGQVRERFFSPPLRVRSYDELNAWLLDQCVAYARAPPSRATRPDGLVGLRGGANGAGAVSRAVRRLPWRGGFGV